MDLVCHARGARGIWRVDRGVVGYRAFMRVDIEGSGVRVAYAVWVSRASISSA